MYRYTKEFQYITAYGGGRDFKAHFNIYIVLNIMELKYVIQICENMFPIKNGVNSINILYAGSHKFFPIHYLLEGNF